MGYWFIRRGQADPASTQENGASLNKFCSFMQEKGKIDAHALNAIKQTIKAMNQADDHRKLDAIPYAAECVRCASEQEEVLAAIE
jgi:RNA polymerase-binding transcription factor DksA